MCIPVYYTVLRDHTGLSPPHTKALTASFPVQPPPQKKKNSEISQNSYGRGSVSRVRYMGTPKGRQG